MAQKSLRSTPPGAVRQLGVCTHAKKLSENEFNYRTGQYSCRALQIAYAGRTGREGTAEGRRRHEKISIVGRDYHSEEHVVGYYNAGDRMKHWGKLGAFWGGIWGVLFGSAFFWIPGVGPLLVAGPLVSAIVGGLEGAAFVGGLNALGAGLFSIGIPKNSVLAYETAIGAGKFASIAHGTPEDVARAKAILKDTEAEAVDHHESAACAV